MSLHSSKKIALLQLCNCLLDCDLKSLEDLCNGDIFVDIISSSFSDCTTDDNKNKQDEEFKGVSETEIEKANIEDTKQIQIIEPEREETGGLEIDTTCVSPVEVEISITEENLRETDVDVKIGEEKVFQNYKVIEKFIDDKYCIRSNEIICYMACIEAKDIELSKVACFILSEVVKLCAFLHNDKLSTLALLDSRVQEDLEECFQLFILERERISKSSIEKMLCHQAKYKSPSPVMRNSFITPRRSCASKYRVSSPTTPSTDDVFTNSPLKSFFESPVFKKEDLIRKDKEIAVTRNILYEEELKAEDLKLEVNEMKEKLHKKGKCVFHHEWCDKKLNPNWSKWLKPHEETAYFAKCSACQKTFSLSNMGRGAIISHAKGSRHQKKIKFKKSSSDDEIQKLKDIIKEMEDSEKIKDEDIKKLIEEKEESTKTFSAAEKELIRENSMLVSRITMLEKEVKDCLNGTCKSGNILKDFMVLKKNLENEKDNSKKLQVELKATKEMLKNKSSELNEVNARLQSVTFDFMKNESFYKEKLNEMKMEKKDEPNSPGSGEIIGSIIEEENKMLRLKLNTAESKIKELEEKLEKFEMLEKDCIPTHQNTRVLSTPDLVDISELPETQNLQDLQNEKELPNSLNVCDMSSSSENVSKNSFLASDNSSKTEIIKKNSFNGYDISSNSEDTTNNLYNRCDILDNSEVVSNNSFTECDTSMCSQVAEKKGRNSKRRWTEIPFSDPTVKLYGTLWKNLNLDNEDGACTNQELNDSGHKNTIASLTFHEFLNLLKISSINVADQYNLGDIYADKKSDADYLSSVLKGEKSKQNISKLVKDFRVFKELLSCLFIFVDSNYTLPTDNFFDWVKSHLENGHRKTKEESLLEKKVADYAFQLKNKENEIESLERNCSIFQVQLEQYKVQLQEMGKSIEDLGIKCRKKEEVAKLYYTKYENCKERVVSLMEMERENIYLRKKLKIVELEKKKVESMYEGLYAKFNKFIAKKDQQIAYLRTQMEEGKKLNIDKENTITKLKSERDKYLSRAKELAKTLPEKDSAVISKHKNDMVKHRDNNDLEYVTEQSLPRRSQRERLNASHMSESFYPDFNSTATRDFNNESTLSGALFSKSGLAGQFVSHDEESFFNQSSLEDIKKVTKEDRLDELKRRNSLYPHHLQSSYPLEMNLTPSANKNLYVKSQENEDSKTTSEKQDSDKTKKRKFEEVDPEIQSNEVLRTPLMKMKRAFRNSSSMKKILNCRRNRPCFIKPKP